MFRFQAAWLDDPQTRRIGVMSRLLILALAASTAGCSAASNGKICSTPPTLDVTPQGMANAPSLEDDPSEQQVLADQCVHRWAYRLAKSPDPAPNRRRRGDGRVF